MHLYYENADLVKKNYSFSIVMDDNLRSKNFFNDDFRSKICIFTYKLSDLLIVFDENDYFCIKNWSLLNSLRIFLKTISYIFELFEMETFGYKNTFKIERKIEMRKKLECWFKIKFLNQEMFRKTIKCFQIKYNYWFPLQIRFFVNVRFLWFFLAVCFYENFTSDLILYPKCLIFKKKLIFG